MCKQVAFYVLYELRTANLSKRWVLAYEVASPKVSKDLHAVVGRQGRQSFLSTILKAEKGALTTTYSLLWHQSMWFDCLKAEFERACRIWAPDGVNGTMHVPRLQLHAMDCRDRDQPTSRILRRDRDAAIEENFGHFHQSWKRTEKAGNCRSKFRARLLHLVCLCSKRLSVAAGLPTPPAPSAESKLYGPWIVLNMTEASVVCVEHNADQARPFRSLVFWSRACSIWAGYKVAQVQAAWLRFQGRSEDYIKEHHWSPHADRAGRNIHALCVELRGFFIKVLCPVGPADRFLKLRA
jgi:hypothetical protein